MNVFISTGEVSGDIQGAHLARALFRVGGDISIAGLGGCAMREAGVTIIDDVSTLSTSGGIENIIPSFIARKVGAFFRARRYIKENRPDVVVLVDNQGFNIPLSAYLAKRGIKNVYYFPPHVGIWGKGNALKLKATCNLVIAQLPLDYDEYVRAGCPVVNSGHPFIDIDVESAPSPAFLSRLTPGTQSRTVAVLPGSRFQEIRTLAPPFFRAMRNIHDALRGDVRFIIPVSYPTYRPLIEEYLAKEKDALTGVTYDVLDGDGEGDVFRMADALILSSGTASLLAATYGKPMIISYKVSPLTYFIGKHIVKLRFIGMPNILAGREVAPELLQHDCNPATIAKHIVRYLTDTAARDEAVEAVSSVRKAFGTRFDDSVPEKVAKIILAMD